MVERSARARIAAVATGMLVLCACEPLFEDVPDAADLDYSTEKYTQDGRYWIEYQPQPAPIPYNDYFEIVLFVFEEDQVTPMPDAALDLDATMPHNGNPHGMTTEPVIVPNGDGSYEVDGMLFHMSGLWNVDVYVGETDVVDDGVRFYVECCGT